MAKPKKQAVLLIHGIGNQRPMATLRGFVKAVWLDHKEIQNDFAGNDFWSKPDTVSRSFELRRLVTPQNKGRYSTDFYEFYWAHLMHGTGYGHVLAWVRSLLWRKPGTVPPGLKLAFWVLWVVVVGLAAVWVAYLAGRFGPVDKEYVPTFPVSLITTLVTVVLVPILGMVVREIVGDAARYLRPAPQNIQRRHEIRAAGVHLLRTLHRRGYERIIVVGHSLGTVIGYDILTYAWPALAQPEPHDHPPDGARTSLEHLAQQIDEGLEVDLDDFQAAQRRYFNELEGNGAKWRVTDFITLGSPLAHADMLLADGPGDLKARKTSRELPKCPPVLEQTIRTEGPTDRHFTYKRTVDGKEFWVPHHAAVFAPTRWTNLYFPSRLIVFGDLIGGPVARVLGKGIRDVAVGTKACGGLFSHTRYWKQTDWRPKAGQKVQESVAALRAALDLVDAGSELGGDEED